jgi:hypothetical protein
MATQVTFDDILKFLRSEGLEFGIGPKNTLALTLKTEKETYLVIIQYIWEKELIVLYVEYTFKATGRSRTELLNLAAYINWGLLFPTCEINTETGVIRFRSTMLTDDAPFYRSQFATMLATACTVAERYSPAFRAVIEGNCTAHEAIDLVRGTSPNAT